MAGTVGARPGAGRKPKDEENRIRDLMKPYSLDAVRCLAEIVANKDAKDSDRISASKLIIAYTYGNPKDTVENTVTLNNIDMRSPYGEQTESDME
jgi:hypothetical protein